MSQTDAPLPPPPLPLDEVRRRAADRVLEHKASLGPTPEAGYLPAEVAAAIPTHSITGTELQPPRPAEEYPWVEGVEVCDTCGSQHVTLRGTRSCAGHRRHYRTPCRDNPMKGVHLCKAHGGKTSNARRGAARRLAAQEAAEALSDVEVDELGNPLDALERTAAEALALKDHFASTVAGLKDQYRFTDDKGAEQLDARVALYERALDRCEKYLHNLVKLGFEERRLALDEARAGFVMLFLRGVLDDLGFNPADPQVREVIETWAVVLDGEPAPRELEELTDPDAEDEPEEPDLHEPVDDDEDES